MGGGGVVSDPPRMSWITSLASRVSARNFTYLFVYEFYAFSQNFGRFCWAIFDLHRFKWPNVLQFLVEELMLEKSPKIRNLKQKANEEQKIT